jgi:ADP-heptose:LPS heptosyltransferase
MPDSPDTSARKPRILVAQMTRMGDVLQTSPLIRSLKQLHPGAYIAVMVRQMGKAIAECNPDVDEVIVYEEDDMFLDLKSEDSDRFLRAYQTADGHVRRLREGRFDVVYNCTHSLSSAILLKLAGIPHGVGAHLSDDFRYVFRGRGPNCFLTNIMNRNLNELNLCDMFRYFVDEPPVSPGLVLSVTETERTAAKALLAGHGIADTDFLVCFQLGASDKDKRWPETQFAALGVMLKERRDAKIALVGVAQEAALGEVFEKHAPGLATHLFGKTNIPQLAAVLERADLLVTNDTGTMHVAAAVRCPIVLTSVGYVHFRETGPYGECHCAIERRRSHLGRSDIRQDDSGGGGMTAAQVLRAVDLILTPKKSKKSPSISNETELDNVDIYWSAFAPDGCLHWFPVIQRSMELHDLLRLAYRAMWVEYLSGKANKRAEDAFLAAILQCYSKESSADFATQAKQAADALDRLSELSQQGARVTEKLLDILTKGKSMKMAQQVVTELMRLDEDIRLFGEVHTVCKPLVAIARFERDNLEGADPVRLAKTTLDIYRGMFSRARLTARKLSRILELRSATK